MYDPATLVRTTSLAGAHGFMSGLQFSEDGATLVASADDGSLSIYDMVSRTRLGDAAPLGAPGNGLGANLRADGKAVVVSTPTGNGAAIWDLDPQHWVDAACSVAQRNLTREEWATYIGDLGAYRATCPEFPADSSSG